MSVVTGLKKAAEEIRAEGHNGWGNACEQAAAHIEEQQDTIAVLREEKKKWVKSRRKGLFPEWECGALSGWAICGMNHYHVHGEKHLFVSMVRDGKCITEEGEDNTYLWQRLRDKAEKGGV